MFFGAGLPTNGKVFPGNKAKYPEPPLIPIKSHHESPIKNQIVCRQTQERENTVIEFETTTPEALTNDQENFIELENNCCLCGTELQFDHSPSETGDEVKEQAHCPNCKIKIKEQLYVIH